MSAEEMNKMLELLVENQKIFMENMLKNQQKLIEENARKLLNAPTTSISPFRPFVHTKESFDEYMAQLKQYFTANNVVTDDRKKACFLSWVGVEAYHTLIKVYGEESFVDKKLDELEKKLREFFETSVHILSSRFKFWQLKMKPGDTYATWIADLREAAAKCSFKCSCNKSYYDYAIRDMIVLHTIHEPVRTAILQKGNPTLEDTIAVAQAYESTQAAISVLKNESGTANHEVNEIKGNRRRSRSRRRSVSRRVRKDFSNLRLKACPGCGTQHNRSRCRFLRAQCYRCSRIGHIAVVCQAGGSVNRQMSKGQQQKRSSDNVYMLQSEMTSEGARIEMCSGSHSVENSIHRSEVLEAESVASTYEVNERVQTTSDILERDGKKVIVSMEINQKPLKFLVDTGATISMVGNCGYEQLGRPVLEPFSASLRAYGDIKIPVIGKIEVEVKLSKWKHKLPLLVTATEGANVMGMDWFDAFGFRIDTAGGVEQLFNIVDIQEKIQGLCEKYSELFDPGLGHCSKFKAHLALKPDHIPRACKPRPIPFEQRDQVKDELERLVSIGVLKPTQFSTWASPIVIVPKSDKTIRICGDFKITVNRHLEVEQYPIPRVEELFHRLQGGKRFSKIDLREAYLQLELDDDSKQLVTVTTPFGMYQYQRLPFGIASAPAIFQRFVEQLTADMDRVTSYLDDIIVTGRSDEEHLKNLEELFKRLADLNLRCNKAKCTFFKEHVEYLGHILDEKGIRPTENRVKAIYEMPRPTDLKELLAFLAPLNELRREGVVFEWSKKREEAFLLLKECIIKTSRLVHYRRDYAVVLATDASSHGIGAVISHKYPDGSEHPIAFASKSLNVHQKRYSQIEKEALSIVFGCDRFRQYLYGRQFELVTDHKPLVALFHPDKALPTTTSNRLQRWAIYLMGFKYTIRYKPTENHGNADALSRLPMGPDEKFDGREYVRVVDQLYENSLYGFPVDAEQISEATRTDSQLVKVMEFVQDGWPNVVERDLKPYAARKDSISVYKKVLLLQTEYTRVIIPAKLRVRVLHMLHEGHFGIVRMKQLARRYCWWPNIDQEIEATVKGCTICQEVAPSPTKSFSSWPLATKPWQRIHLDFAGPFLNGMWLLCVDSFARYPFVIKMPDITTPSTIRALKVLFAIEGLPDAMVTDNETSFTSEGFADFCQSRGIEHLTTAPFHPASNGEAERFVRTFKTAMLKHIKSGEATEEALLKFLSTYRFSPGLNNKSPSELLHGRQPKTTLSLLFPPETYTKSNIIPKFEVEQPVFVRNFSRGPKWVKGVVKEVRGRMMYIVETDHGTVRRHQNQMRVRSPEDEPYGEADLLLRTMRNTHTAMNDQVTVPMLSGSSPTSILRQSLSSPTIPDPPRKSSRIRKPVVRLNI